MEPISRRRFGVLSLSGLGAALGLAACGDSAGSTGSSTAAASNAYKSASLTLGWWGNAVRDAYTAKIAQKYEGEHSDIKVALQPGQWPTYWTKLSTQVAGGTAPDMIQMDQAYIAEYGGRGALYDLSKVGSIDFSTIDKSAVENGTINGKVYGISTGNNAYAVLANKDLFKKAGVPMPDDTTWTWDDYLKIAQKLHDASGGAFVGTGWGGGVTDVQLWARQNGEKMWTNDGKLGVSTKTLTEWMDYSKKLFANGAGPAPDAWVQDIAASTEQSLFGTKKAAMNWNWSNQLTSFTSATGSNVVLLRPPSMAGSASKAEMFYKPSMFWSMSSQTKNAAQTGGLINYFLNSVEAGKLGLTERGVPVNPQVLEAVKPLLTPVDLASLTFVQSIKDELGPTPNVPPKGTSTSASVIQRHLQDVLFGRASSADAAKATVSELQNLIASA